MSTARLDIDGMSCGACAVRLEKALRDTGGIDSAQVNYASERAELSFDASTISLADITEVVRESGFAARESTHRLGIDGLTRAACAARAEAALHGLDGVLDVDVNLATDVALVRSTSPELELSDAARVLEAAGFGLRAMADTGASAGAVKSSARARPEQNSVDWTDTPWLTLALADLHELERADKSTALISMCCGASVGTGTIIERI